MGASIAKEENSKRKGWDIEEHHLFSLKAGNYVDTVKICTLNPKDHVCWTGDASGKCKHLTFATENFVEISIFDNECLRRTKHLWKSAEKPTNVKVYTIRTPLVALEALGFDKPIGSKGLGLYHEKIMIVTVPVVDTLSVREHLCSLLRRWCCCQDAVDLDDDDLDDDELDKIVIDLFPVGNMENMIRFSKHKKQKGEEIGFNRPVRDGPTKEIEGSTICKFCIDWIKCHKRYPALGLPTIESNCQHFARDLRKEFNLEECDEEV